MADSYGIVITAPGTDVTGAPTAQVIMDTSKPFLKIDTQTTTGFQTLTLLITTDPPEPVGPATDAYTVVYKFAHGYKYIPSVETLFFVTNPPPGATFTQTYFQDSGQIGAHTVDDAVFLYAVTDATYVYFVIDKFNDQSGLGQANLLTGTNINITTHVFVDDTGF